MTHGDAFGEGELQISLRSAWATAHPQPAWHAAHAISYRARDASDSTATGATQFARGNADLSQRTGKRAANLQPTAASMAPLGTAVAHKVQTTDRAAALASPRAQSERMNRPLSRLRIAA